ncbi:MGDG synthase family glycosyltransferase [Peribacillus glennii]|uniref:Diacylglycerol glucosyltransferase N-terminal domain-containing protein n=1 Tax=Peribacillus glennii TaxID=2303991 RepID=A0A372LEZ8_9BACI|nr:hypothetical protein [Peribacillus glennii]RFU64893.1 hypothetical protein D0466_02940 [Peribacillus glennii]
MKILVLPLFQFPTGHLKVAETIKEYISAEYPESDLEIVDFLSYCNDSLEKMVSSIYFSWINTSPSIYRTLYNTIMYSENDRKFKVDFRLFSLYFESKMMQLIEKVNPSLIICSHSFPSSIIGKLKQKGRLMNIPVINIYTDFFINDVWAKKEIEYHLVPHSDAKKTLINEHNIKEDCIFATGIPIKSSFTDPAKKAKNKLKHVLVAGGNNGLYNNGQFIEMMKDIPSVAFTVLCGNNKDLFHQLNALEVSHIHPKGYIENPWELNDIYNEVDAILTKPGGVTISEALHKRLPIFVHNWLPGQEEINLKFLLQEGLVMCVSPDNFLEELQTAISNEEEISALKKRIECYLEKESDPFPDAISYIIEKELSLASVETERVAEGMF